MTAGETHAAMLCIFAELDAAEAEFDEVTERIEAYSGDADPFDRDLVALGDRVDVLGRRVAALRVKALGYARGVHRAEVDALGKSEAAE